METPQKQLYERTITKSLKWGPMYADNVFEFLQGEDDETKKQILGHIKSVRLVKITGMYRDEKFVVEPEPQLQFGPPAPSCGLKNVLQLDWSTPDAPVTTDYFLGMWFGLRVIGYFFLETGKVFLTLRLSRHKHDTYKFTEIDAIDFTEVEIELIYESDTLTPPPTQRGRFRTWQANPKNGIIRAH